MKSLLIIFALFLTQISYADSFFNIGFTAAPEGHAYNLGYTSSAFFKKTLKTKTGLNLKAFIDVQNITAPNLLTENSKFKKTDYTLLTVGPRIDFQYSSNHFGILEVAPTYLIDSGDLSDENGVGLRIGFGYGIKLHENAEGSLFDSQFAIIKMDKVFQLNKADKISTNPDVFNGAYITIGLGLKY